MPIVNDGFDIFILASSAVLSFFIWRKSMQAGRTLQELNEPIGLIKEQGEKPLASFKAPNPKKVKREILDIEVFNCIDGDPRTQPKLSQPKRLSGILVATIFFIAIFAFVPELNAMAHRLLL